MICVAGNMLSILFISVDRYIYIAYALRYHAIVTNTRIGILLATTWIYLVFAVPIMFWFSQHLELGVPCKWQLFLDENLVMFIIFPQSLCAILSTIGFYLAIARIAYKQSKAIAALNQPFDTIEASINKKSWKFIKLLGTILGVYLVSILPQYIMNFLLHGSRRDILTIKLEKITTILFWSNIWVNPIIYVWRLEDFRKVLQKLVNRYGNTVHAMNINP